MLHRNVGLQAYLRDGVGDLTSVENQERDATPRSFPSDFEASFAKQGYLSSETPYPVQAQFRPLSSAISKKLLDQVLCLVLVKLGAEVGIRRAC